MTETNATAPRGEFVESIEDPRLDPFRDLRNGNPIGQSGFVIAEGRLTVTRLLQSPLRTVSVVVDAERERLLPPDIDAGIEILRLPHDAIRQLVGFDFHRGLIACGERPQARNLADAAEELFGIQSATRLDVMLCGVTDPENVGVIVRSAAAFGVDSLIIGPGTADPYGRRALRVSMANVLNFPVLQTRTPAADLSMLRERYAVRSVAATLSPLAVDLASFEPGGQTILVLGNEFAGIAADIHQACSDHVTLPMRSNVDSLNVSVAGGIFLYALSRHAAPKCEKTDRNGRPHC